MSAIEKLETSLPIGFNSKNTEFKEFELGPVKGRLRREYLNLRKRSPARETLVALKHVVTRLGPIDKPDENLIQRLPLPDVDYLFLLISAREFEGGKITWNIDCGDPEDPETAGCGTELSLSVDPGDVGLLEANPAVEFSDKGRPIQRVLFKDPVSGREIPIVWAVPTLGDQISLFDKLSATKGVDFGNLLFYQMSHIMIDYDDRGKGLTVEEIDDLPVRTVDALLEHNNKHNPTQLDTEVTVTCDNCGATHAVELPLEEWLVPFAGRRPSKS